jgi:hypothetical protein
MKGYLIRIELNKIYDGSSYYHDDTIYTSKEEVHKIFNDIQNEIDYFNLIQEDIVEDYENIIDNNCYNDNKFASICNKYGIYSYDNLDVSIIEVDIDINSQYVYVLIGSNDEICGDHYQVIWNDIYNIDELDTNELDKDVVQFESFTEELMEFGLTHSHEEWQELFYNNYEYHEICDKYDLHDSSYFDYDLRELEIK